jgi:probable rRNA maturation factor
MRLILDFNDLEKSGIKKPFLFDVVEKILNKTVPKLFQKKELVISIAAVNEKEIRALNRIYRKKDLATDILSFSEYKSKKQLAAIVEKNIFLGELVLCYNNIKKYSKKNEIDMEKELTEVVSHGVLHLLGFKHGKKMFSIQKEISS